jgi:hypothetical protein
MAGSQSARGGRLRSWLARSQQPPPAASPFAAVAVRHPCSRRASGFAARVGVGLVSLATACNPLLADSPHDRSEPVARATAAAAATARPPYPALLELLGSLPEVEDDWASALDWALQESSTEVDHEGARP